MLGHAHSPAGAAPRPLAGTDDAFERGFEALMRAVLDVDDLGQSVDLVCERAATLLGGSSATVWLADAQCLVVRAHAPRTGTVAAPVPLDDPSSMLTQVMRENRSAVAVSETGSIIITPIIGRAGRQLGVLSCALPLPPREAERLGARATLLSGLAGHAVEKARFMARFHGQREDLRAVRQLKSDFVATMSHELRTPLNVVMGYSDLLADEAFGTLTTEQRGVLDRIQHSARELFELVTATLDLSRLESGQARVEVERVDVGTFMAQLRSETQTRVGAPNVELVWDVPDGLPTLETDLAKLQTIMRNLIANALKFTERGRITVSAQAAPHGVLFTVEDTGIGIEREHLPIIFEMFRQIESPDTRRFGGVGLGLYVVKRLLDELGGDVQVSSQPGVGSKFRVHVPRKV